MFSRPLTRFLYAQTKTFSYRVKLSIYAVLSRGQYLICVALFLMISGKSRKNFGKPRIFTRFARFFFLSKSIFFLLINNRRVREFSRRRLVFEIVRLAVIRNSRVVYRYSKDGGVWRVLTPTFRYPMYKSESINQS